MMQLALVLLILLALSAAIYAMDLEALARRERERRRALAAQSSPTAATFTNDDLARYRGEDVEPVEGRKGATPRSKPRDLAKQRAYWESETRRHERELDRIDANIRRLERRLQEKKAKRRPGERVSTDPAIEVLEDSLESLREERSRVEERFRERARKAGALPGWLR